MKSVIIILLMLFVNLFSQDNGFVGDWAQKSEYTDKSGNKQFHRVVVTIEEDSTFKIKAIHKTINAFNDLEEAILISEGTWTYADASLQMEVKYKRTNEFETKYFKNFPRLVLVGYSNDTTRLVETIYRWQSKTQITELYKEKLGFKSEEFFYKTENKDASKKL